MNIKKYFYDDEWIADGEIGRHEYVSKWWFEIVGSFIAISLLAVLSLLMLVALG